MPARSVLYRACWQDPESGDWIAEDLRRDTSVRAGSESMAWKLLDDAVSQMSVLEPVDQQLRSDLVSEDIGPVHVDAIESCKPLDGSIGTNLESQEIVAVLE